MAAISLQKDGSRIERPAEQTAFGDTATSVHPVRPRRRIALGRHLAFTLGEESIQMAAAWHAGPTVQLLDVRKHYVPASDSPAKDPSGKIIRGEIRRYIREFGGRQPTVAVTLTGPETALRLITLPHLRRSELASALTFETKRQIPFPADDCWISHRIVEQTRQGGERQVRAAVLVATKASVERRLAPFKDLGIRVDYVYHTQEVVGQLLSKLSDFSPAHRYMLIDIHRRHTEIAYYQGTELKFFHVSSLGSSFLANRKDDVVFEYFAESLVTELQNSMDYYGGQFSSHNAQEVFIYGDLAYTDELIKLLANRVGFGFRRFPTERLKLTRGRSAPFESELPVCLPAVAAATNQVQIADLLPLPLKIRRQQRTADRTGVAALALVAIMAVGQWLLMTAGIAGDRHTLKDLQRQVLDFRSSELFVTYSQVKTRIAANQAYLERTKESQSYLGLSLKELTHLVPGGVRLTNLEYTSSTPEKNCTLSGLISSGDTSPEIVLAELVENLAASPFFDSVQVDRYVKRQQNNQFVLDFNLSMRAVI